MPDDHAGCCRGTSSVVSQSRRTFQLPARRRDPLALSHVGDERCESGCVTAPVGVKRRVELVPVIPHCGVAVVEEHPPPNGHRRRSGSLSRRYSRVFNGVTNTAPESRSTGGANTRRVGGVKCVC